MTEAAGGDPWQLNKTIQSGSPGEISELAGAFYEAGVCTQETSDEFNTAKQRFDSAWDRQDSGEHPINDSSEVERATELLRLDREQMSRIAVDLQNISASLAEAQRSADISIGNLETRLQMIDRQIDREIATAVANGREVDVSDLRQAAVEATARAVQEVQAIRGTYSETLDAARLEMAAEGYTDPTTDGQQTESANSQASTEAERYDGGQRAVDETLVHSPGPWTPEKNAAAGRLRDLATINNPTAGVDEIQFAGQRLNDHYMAQFAGPLPRDTVAGGDARTRALARLQMQDVLESQSYFADKPPMTPDQATQMLNHWEAQGRTMVLQQFATQLREAGVSSQGAAAAVNQVQNGASPAQVIRDATSSLATQASALGEGAKAHARAMPSGAHWGTAPVWSQSDVEALKGFGSRLGSAGTAVDLVLTGVDIYNGASTGEELAQFGGRTLGTIGGGWAAGAAWGSLVGPQGTLVVGFLGAIAGGIGGEIAVNKMMGK